MCFVCILTNGNAKTFKYCANIYLNVDNGDCGASSSNNGNNNHAEVEKHSKLQAKQMPVSPALLSLSLSLTPTVCLSVVDPLLSLSGTRIYANFLFTIFGKCRTSVCVCVRLLCCTI